MDKLPHDVGKLAAAKKRKATTPSDVRDAKTAHNNELKKAFDKLVAMETQVVVESPFVSEAIPALPAADPHLFDLLSDANIAEFARCIVEDQVSPEIAAMAVGIPPETMVEYIDAGAADLAAGIPSRKAVLASVAYKASYAVIRASLHSIHSLPVGWQNHAWSLARMFPHFFSDKRASKKENAAGAALEALHRQLGGAMMARPSVHVPPPSAPGNVIEISQ